MNKVYISRPIKVVHFEGHVESISRLTPRERNRFKTLDHHIIFHVMEVTDLFGQTWILTVMHHHT